MITALVLIESLSIACPHCKEFQVSNGTGAQSFTEDDYDQLTAFQDRHGRAKIVCWNCNTEIVLPVIIKKLWD